MFDYNLYKVNYELSHELNLNLIRYPQDSQRVAQKCCFAVLRIKLTFHDKTMLQSFFEVKLLDEVLILPLMPP